MNGLGYHYPAGAEHDPSAPYNLRDESDCGYCDGRGYVNDQDNNNDCPYCSGTGKEKTQAELHAEWEDDKADMEREDQ
jgi:DnaJ-class molecular chaperone